MPFTTVTGASWYPLTQHRMKGMCFNQRTVCASDNTECLPQAKTRCVPQCVCASDNAQCVLQSVPQTTHSVCLSVCFR
eukprot:scaffold91377_cov25-Tisochrysis_lutea.AAC.2